jgi:hypothetical protein
MADSSKKLTAMRRNRAQYFPEQTRAAILQFEVQAVNGWVRFKILKPGAEEPFRFELSPDDAYEIREDIGRAYDDATAR